MLMIVVDFDYKALNGIRYTLNIYLTLQFIEKNPN